MIGHGISELSIIDVFAVVGDFGNCGDGSLLGVFTDENKAISASKGRGSLDCGGDGRVESRKAIKYQDGKVNLLALDFPISLNTIVTPNPRDGNYKFKIKLSNVKQPIQFMTILRRRTGMSLKDVKEFTDAARSLEGAIVGSNSVNLSGIYTKEEAFEFKQEFELNNVATVEVL